MQRKASSFEMSDHQTMLDFLMPRVNVIDDSKFKAYKDFTPTEVETALEYICLWSEHDCRASYKDVWRDLLWRLLWYSKKDIGCAPATLEVNTLKHYMLTLHLLSRMVRSAYGQCYDTVRNHQDTPIAFKKVDVIGDLMAVRLLRRTFSGPKSFLLSSCIHGGVVDATRPFIETHGDALELAKAIFAPVRAHLRSLKTPLRVVRTCAGCAISVITCALADKAEEKTSGERDFPWFNRPVLISRRDQGVGYGRGASSNVSIDNHRIKILFAGFPTPKGKWEQHRCIYAHVPRATAMRDVLAKVVELYPDAAAFLGTFEATHKLYWPGTSGDRRRLAADGPLKSFQRVDVLLEAWMAHDVEELNVEVLQKAALATVDAVQDTAFFGQGSHLVLEIPSTISESSMRLTFKITGVKQASTYKLGVAATISKAKVKLAKICNGFNQYSRYSRMQETNFYKHCAGITARIE
jgi:hypothetical protein